MGDRMSAHRTDARGGRHGRRLTGRPRRAYIVDDDVATLELVSEVARLAGWEAHGFTRLSTVHRALDRARPDLLIVDDDLPDGRGGDLVRALRRQERTRELNVLFCTAARPERRAELGVVAPVLAKPFDVSELEGFLRLRANGGDTGSAQPAD